MPRSSALERYQSAVAKTKNRLLARHAGCGFLFTLSMTVLSGSVLRRCVEPVISVLTAFAWRFNLESAAGNSWLEVDPAAVRTDGAPGSRFLRAPS